MAVNEIMLVGMSYKTAPVAIREQLAVACRQELNPRNLLDRTMHLDELVLLSTCNRVEFLFTCADREMALREVESILSEYLGCTAEELQPSLYSPAGLNAVRHLFRVAASLDSMVIGEPQILGQIKAAYRTATEIKSVGVILTRLLHKTFSVAKKVRSETCIGSCAVSVSYAAVELAKKIFGKLEGKRVLLIGAGEMAELAAEHLIAQGVRHITIANRTLENAVELARRFRGETIPFDHLLGGLLNADIVISSTGSADPILTYRDVRSKMRERRNKPLFFIDIAVPRDIDPKVNDLENVYVYDIDDLQGVVDTNRQGRDREAEKAEHIVAEETHRFKEWLATLDVVPTIVALRQKAEEIRRNELQKTMAQTSNLDEKSRQAIEILTESIINKLLHDPILFLKRKAERDSRERYIDFTQQLFNLTNGDHPEEASLTDGIPGVNSPEDAVKTAGS